MYMPSRVPRDADGTRSRAITGVFLICRPDVAPHSSSVPTQTDDHPRHVPGKRPRPGRTTERAAIRAAQAVFENSGMHVQEVDTANDIGKDLYVDLVADGAFTGELIALQVKGGPSYRGLHGSHQLRASADDRYLWANSPVPVFGLVHDPAQDCLYWANLTAWSRAHRNTGGSLTATMSTWALTERTLEQFLHEARAFLGASGPPALLGLADENDELQIQAVHDAFALGRRDARPLLLVRRSMLYLSDEALAHAIRILSLALVRSHGDILWSASNWIENEVRGRVSGELSQWSVPETSRMLALPDGDEWSRGALGQDVAALLGSGWHPDVQHLLEEVATTRPFDAAWPALMLLVNSAGDDGQEAFESVVSRSPALRSSQLVGELGCVLAEHGSAYQTVGSC